MYELKSLRDAFGEALVELGKTNPDVIVLDADVSSSTKTCAFAGVFPKRFFNLGVAEANMMDIAAGLAATGKIPFVSTFSFLASLKAIEQLRSSIAYSKLNVKIAGGYAGLSDSFDGASHQSICDIAVIRSLPNMTLIVPVDAIEVRKAVMAAAKYAGPVYLRLCRNEVPIISEEEMDFTIGKGIVRREGFDVTIVVTGILLDESLKAAEALAKKKISVRVIEIHTIKPIDKDIIVKAAGETKGIVTVEEHSIVGGLGSAVCEIVSFHHPCRVEMVGIEDRFAESGHYNELLEKYILKNKVIEEKCRNILRKEK